MTTETLATKKLTVRAVVFAEALARVWHAAAKDYSRPILASVLIEGDVLGVRLVAADNYRIAIASIAAGDHTWLGDVVIGRDHLKSLRALLGGADDEAQIHISREEHSVTFLTPHWGLTLPLVDGDYPEYRQLLDKVPLADRSRVVFNPQLLADAARAVGKYAPTIHLHFGGALDPVVFTEGDDFTEVVMPVRVAGQFPTGATS